MNKIYCIISVCISMLFLQSCQEEPQDIDMQNLNGYWEIVQAQNPYGKNVIYKINTQVDYFEVKDSMGFRKKMKPDLNGNYKTSKAIDRFTWRKENDTIRLNYKTPYDKRTVDLLRLNDSLMLIKNKNDFLYTYKRFEAININP